MILNIKICNKPPCCHILVLFMYVKDVHKHQSYFHMISKDLDV